MTREGPDLVRELVGRGLKVFLDLKWHDIPNTVSRRACAPPRSSGVAHGHPSFTGGPGDDGGGRREAGRQAGAGRGHGPDLARRHLLRRAARPRRRRPGAGGRRAWRRRAADAGLAGVVCSPREVAAVRRLLGPEARIVVPGIRRPADAPVIRSGWHGSRGRVAAGATHLVVGRPIVRAPDPAATFLAVPRARPMPPVPGSSWPCCSWPVRAPTGSARPADRRGAGPAGLVLLRMPRAWWSRAPGLRFSFPAPTPRRRWTPQQAAAAARRLSLRPLEEVETVVRAARAVGGGRGYVELSAATGWPGPRRCGAVPPAELPPGPERVGLTAVVVEDCGVVGWDWKSALACMTSRPAAILGS